MRAKTKLLTVFAGILGFVACTPNLYFIDRHTVMEVEASGEWPSLDEDVFKTTKKKGVTYFEKSQDTKRKQKIFNTLDGEYTTKTF